MRSTFSNAGSIACTSRSGADSEKRHASWPCCAPASSTLPGGQARSTSSAASRLRNRISKPSQRQAVAGIANTFALGSAAGALELRPVPRPRTRHRPQVRRVTHTPLAPPQAGVGKERTFRDCRDHVCPCTHVRSALV
eukprot:2734707-Prymnesium_polylepis.2